MKKGKLKNGFEFEVDESVFDDMELLDDLAESQNEDPLKISFVLKKILGEDQRKRLYDHLRNEAGRVPVEETMDAILEIMEIAGGEDGKN